VTTLAETNIYRVWAARQSAKGTPATSATQSFRQVGGTVAAAIESGTENFSDGTIFGDTTTWLNSLTGTGSPALEASTNELAWLLWMFHGTETVTPAGTNDIKTLSMAGTPTGGSTTATVNGQQVGALAFNATSTAVQAAFEAVPYIGVGNVVAAGGPWPGTPITLTFQGARAKMPVASIVFPASGAAGNSLTGGSTPAASSANTTPGVNATHTVTASGAAGFWMTWWQTVGASTIQRLKMNDGRIGTITLEASTGTKAMRVTPTLLFVDPAEAYAVDPTPAMPTSPTMIYTEGAGGWQIDGQVFTGTTQFQLTLNLDLSFLYADDITPFDLVRGNVGATLATSVLFDDTMLAKWNTWLYGTAAPAPGAKPIKRIPPLGSYSSNMQKKDLSGNTYGSVKTTIPGVQWELPDSPGPSPDQGSAEVALTGRLQRVGANPLYTIDVGCQAAAFTG
jgi:hypothetical protein